MKPSHVMRLDQLLVHLGLVESRTTAQKMINNGQVEQLQAGVWCKVDKPARKYLPDERFRVQRGEEQKYVSRAGLKLASALTHMNLDVAGYNALDVGQSTGGFSDCLLQHGCARVTGIEVGHNQLHERLRSLPNVRCLEGINARYLTLKDITDDKNDLVDLVVMDVSFISQTLILPNLATLLKPGGQLLSLVKPQYEVGPQGLSKGGIVKDPALFEQVKQKVYRCLQDHGFAIQDYFDSPITGGDGNCEFFVAAVLQ